MSAATIEMPLDLASVDKLITGNGLALSGGLGGADQAVEIARFRREDSAGLFEAARESINELCTWMVWCRPDYSMEHCSTFLCACDLQWERGESFSFAIRRPKDGTILGSAGLNRVDRAHHTANLGYWVRSSQAGRGVASLAVYLVARYSFQEIGFNRLEMVVPQGNRASQRVAEKIGAKREGILRSRLILQGAPCDAILYSLLPGDLHR